LADRIAALFFDARVPAPVQNQDAAAITRAFSNFGK
jgi:hypothetical protein